MKRAGGQAPVGALLHRLLNAHPAFSTNPLGDWSEIVGEQVAQYSQPISLKRKVLTIVAYDSVWKHHLEILKVQLREKINQGRPEPLVDEIKVRVGELPMAPVVLNPQRRELDKLKARRLPGVKKQKAPLRPLTPEEQALVRQLPDAELRRLATRLLRRVPLDSPLEEGDEEA